MADIGIAANISGGSHAAQNTQPVARPLPERAALEAASSVGVAPAAAVADVAASERAPAANASANVGGASDSSVDLNQLVTRGQTQESGAPRSQQQVDNQRQQLENIVAATEATVPESKLEAQA